MHCHTRLASLTVLLLLAAALAARALVPTGWMPVADQGGVRILLCSGQGPVTKMISLGGQQPDHGQDQTPPNDTCPFALLAQPFDMADHGILPVAPVIGTELPVAALAAVRLVVWRSLRPPARGPPAFA